MWLQLSAICLLAVGVQSHAVSYSSRSDGHGHHGHHSLLGHHGLGLNMLNYGYPGAHGLPHLAHAQYGYHLSQHHGHSHGHQHGHGHGHGHNHGYYGHLGYISQAHGYYPGHNSGLGHHDGLYNHGYQHLPQLGYSNVVINRGHQPIHHGYSHGYPHAPLHPNYVHGHNDHHTFPEYNFSYSVQDPHTGDNKAQHESRHGGVVNGEYHLVQPDGNVRYVHYSADDHTGFKADVHYKTSHGHHDHHRH